MIDMKMINKKHIEQSSVWKKFQIFFLSSWWVILFILLCGMSYEYGLQTLQRDFVKLHEQYIDLQKEKNAALALQRNLKVQINSQSDPDWIELTLIKKLGVVPEDQVKVFFSDKSE